MRKFYVVYYTEYNDVVTTEIELNHNEKANETTFHSKINEIYDNTCGWIHYCNEVLSWSLIEE